jgi:hypothetical protein
MGNPKKKKVTPSPIFFSRHRGVWYIVGPAELMKEGDLVYVRKGSGQHERVRVIEILDITDGEASATFERKEKQHTRRGGRKR